MKKNIVLFIVATSIAFTACKKNNNNNPVPENKQLLSKVTETSATDTTITNLTYDNNKRLSLIKTSDGEETKLTYNGNDLVGIENKFDSEKTTLKVTYNNGKPASAVYSIYEDNALAEKFNVTYTLTGDAVTEILFKDSTNTPVYRNVITYQNNNITKVETFSGNNSLGKQEFTYGTKKSMFYNSRVKYVVDMLTVNLYSANEALTEKSALMEKTNAYTYDSNGYPVSANVSEKLAGGNTTTSKLKLEY
jgi:YD repeat-containing protein